jgi:hypothetical protein
MCRNVGVPLITLACVFSDPLIGKAQNFSEVKPSSQQIAWQDL